MASTKEQDLLEYAKAQERFKQAQAAYEKGRSTASSAELQKLLRDYNVAKRDVTERTPMGALGAGFLRTATETATAIPDLLAMGGNWAARGLFGKEAPQAPVLGEKLMAATGQSAGPKTEDLSTMYNIPGYVATAYGATQLALGLKNLMKSAKEASKIKEFQATLPAEENNVFSKYILKGQGSSDPTVNAVIDKLKRNPKFAEIFQTLEKQVGKEAVSAIRVRPSSQTEEEAASGIFRAVKNKVDNLITARAEAGNKNFEEAFKLGGNRELLSTDTLLNKVRAMKASYAKQDTDSAKAAAKWLQEIEDGLVPSFTTKGGGGTTVVRQGEAGRTIPGATGYSTTEAGTASRTIPGSPSRTVTEEVLVTKYDSLGMPYQSKEMRTRTVPAAGGTTVAGTPDITRTAPSSPSTYIAGTPDVTMNIPGAQPYKVTQAPRKLTVEEVQAKLKEWGRNAVTEGTAVRDLAVSDETRISKVLFGALKDDIAKSKTLATSVDDKRALGALESAREQTRVASEQFNNFVGKGVPKALQNKTIGEVELPELQKIYEGLSPTQRTLFRGWVKENRAESLQALDKAVFDDFLKSGYGPLSSGDQGYDLGKLAQNWQKLRETDPNKAAALTDSLGTTFSEFSKRMRDGLVFAKKMELGAGSSPEASTLSKVAKALPAVVGSTPAGYQGAKVTQLSTDVLEAMLKDKGLSDEMLMKALLTKEGGDFLKNAAMSPNSAKTLESLTTLQKTPIAGPVSFLAPTITSTQQKPSESTAGGADEVFIPEGIFQQTGTQQQPAQPSSMPAQPAASDDVYIPEGIFGASQPTAAPTQAQRDQGRTAILQSEYDQRMQALQTATDPAARQRLQIDLESLQKEMSRK